MGFNLCLGIKEGFSLLYWAPVPALLVKLRLTNTQYCMENEIH